MEFRELTDNQWSFIKPHTLPQPIVYRKKADDRKTTNGIPHILITGCRWCDMPRCYGTYQTVWRKHKTWSEEGVWNKILSILQERTFAIGVLSLDAVAIDSTLID